jgi:photosystem II PsbU protein
MRNLRTDGQRDVPCLATDGRTNSRAIPPLSKRYAFNHPVVILIATRETKQRTPYTRPLLYKNRLATHHEAYYLCSSFHVSRNVASILYPFISLVESKQVDIAKETVPVVCPWDCFCGEGSVLRFNDGTAKLRVCSSIVLWGRRRRLQSTISFVRFVLLLLHCRYLIRNAFSPLIYSSVAAFVQHSTPSRPATELSAERRAFLSAATAALVAATPFAANAVRDYENVGYLGGSEIVDINNANVRVYLKMPGMYPTVAGKVASNGPYSSVSDVYNIPGLTGAEKEILKKYESRFVAKKPEADYVIDKINNGLYK